jgi:hypothetical protein
MSLKLLFLLLLTTLFILFMFCDDSLEFLTCELLKILIFELIIVFSVYFIIFLFFFMNIYEYIFTG